MRKVILVAAMCMACIAIGAQRVAKAGAVLPEGTSTEGYFTQQEIPDEVFCRMEGRSFGKDCTTKRAELRYLRLLHRNFRGETQVGEMVCNRRIAADLVEIFRKLYEAGYPIERMLLVDEYGADDERSMAANNTSCFNFRRMTSGTRVSLHGLGMAVDINPLYNPYVSSKGRVSPAAGRPYAANRHALSLPRVPRGRNVFIRHSDLCHTLFLSHGFTWGGSWRHSKDYQHFEKR